MASQSPSTLPWRVEDLDFSRIETVRIRDDRDMLYLLAASSFIEITSDTYVANLAQYYEGDQEIVQWLSDHWEHEEVQHGRALRAYVSHVWPEFDWQVAYDHFFAEYRKLCTVEEFEPSRGLEMVARCVVETGTSTFYRSLHGIVEEPFLRELADRIRTDEVRHYKYFYRYFNQYNGQEQNGRWRVARVLGRRALEARNSDAEIGLWHAFHQMNPQEARDGAVFKAMVGRVNQRVRQHYPVEQAVKMLLKPLHLPPSLNFIHSPIAFVVQKLVFH